MPSIFVSYRRTDAPGHAGRLYDRLADRFGEANVFKDLDSLEPGADFAEVIEETVARCDALIAVIGSDWLLPRLEDPDDWVRLEIANALTRKVRVVPVLVEGATMPDPSELPDELSPLTRRHGVDLSETSWNAQVTELLDSLERAVGAPRKPEQNPGRPAAADLGESTRWTAQLVHGTSVTWVFRVKLDHETHNVVCRNHVRESVEIDGQTVAKTSLMGTADEKGLHGVLSDGPFSRQLVWQSAGRLGLKRRLTIGGKPLWEG